MRKKSRYVFLGFLMFFLISKFVLAADVKKADSLFDKGTFQEALKEYEIVYKETADFEIRWKAFFRVCESLAHLYRYGESAEKIISTPVPNQMPQKAHVLILKAEMLRNFLTQYSSIQEQDVIDQEKDKEVFRMTPGEIKDEIKSAYRQLWELRNELAVIDLKKEEYFFDVKDIDSEMYPTLFDYLILSWTDFLIDTEAQSAAGETIKPKADLFLVEEFERPVNLDDLPLILAAELMEEANRTNLRSRLEAGERWKIKRILLPLKYTNMFNLTELADDKTLYDDSDLKEYERRAKDILLKWMGEFKSNEACAEAGYETALILNRSNELVETVELCEELEKNFPNTYGSENAETLRLDIQMPKLSIQAKTVTPPASEAFTITTKNLKTVFFRVYQVTPQTLKDELNKIQAKKYGSSYYESFSSWSNIFNLSWSYNDWGKEWLKSYLTSRTPYKEWKVQTKDEGNYAEISETESPPQLEEGIYLVLAAGDDSFKIGTSIISACFLNVTDIVLIGTAGFTDKVEEAYYDFIETGIADKINGEGFHFYALNAKTGKPVEDVDLNIYAYLSQPSKSECFNLKTDKEGIASLCLPVDVSPRSYNYFYANPLAKSRNSFSYWNNDQYLNYSPHSPVELFIETDRPIYRPGDKVQVKAVAVLKTPEGFKTIGDEDNKSVVFSATDPNGKEFFNKDIKLNEFGSASVDFEIPKGRLLGGYAVEAKYDNGRLSNNSCIYFSVEEYKRPEFEIVLKPAEEPWKYNEPVEIKGEAKYYFGGPVPDAPVKYRIKRQTYIPWCYRYWFGQNYSASKDEITFGELKTDSLGNFIIPFTPTPPPEQYGGNIPDIAQFIVEVEGLDVGGRTIETKEYYKAAKFAVYFVIEPKKGFFLENEAIEIASKLLTVNDTAVTGEGSYEVFNLADTPAKSLTELGFEYGGCWNWIMPLDVQLKDVPNDKLTAEGKVNYDKDGKCDIKLAALSGGVYRIILKSKDKWGQDIKQDKTFVVAKDIKEETPVNAASITLAEKDEYNVGDTARFVIGSGLGSGVFHIELWAGEYLIGRQLVYGDQKVRLIEIPVTQKMKGGFALRWFGVKDFNINYGQTAISVPWQEKKLKVVLDPFNKDLLPDKEVSWGVKISDAEGKPAKAEVLALMYDRSLEYYMTSHNPWLDSLYDTQDTPFSLTYTMLKQYGQNLPIIQTRRQIKKEPNLPGLRTWRTWAGGRCFFAKESARGAGEDLMEAMPAAPEVKAEAKKADYKEAAKEVETRKEFADTAFFRPHVCTSDKDGSALFSFTAPSQLTSWRIKLFAFTNDVKEGVLTEEAVTKKDLMVRVDLPRFFREKDKGTITAVVHNESGQSLQGELFIDITENGENINQKLKLEDNKKSFKIESHSLSSFNWMLEVPQGVSTYKVRVAAVTDKLSDAEERDLPILPSRQRLIESAFITLSGNETKNLEISLKDDPTRINESMVLQIEPQLFLSILNTMPFLVEYPYECVEQILNKYVPLSVVNEVYKKYPAIQKAVSKIPDRKTQTPSWEKDDPRRLLTLMETPWVWQSEGRPVTWPVVDLLDPKVVEEQKEINLSKLTSAQLANGAFPWWPGGQPDTYMTLYVLSGLAQARRYGVSVPFDMVQNALIYVNKEIPLLLKPEERELSLVAFAAYVVTSYQPSEFPEAQKGYEEVKLWIPFLEQNIHALTALGKAYLCFTYIRLGDKKRAEEVLDMAMDGAKEDPVAGVYWAPEKYSWVWYSDTVEKHAFLLRTLQELRPEDKRIPGMVKWLIFNRKGTVWKSTKSSVEAIYSLLDYLNKVGALASDELFKIKWGEKIFSKSQKADDWLDEPIRFQEKDSSITPEMSKAIIEKEGPGLSFASMTWTYSTDETPEAKSSGLLDLDRKFYVRVKEGDVYHLKPIESGSEVSVGDQIEVQLKINTRSQFEYMHLKDLKAAGFEAETLLSGWKYDPLWFYEEPRDSLTNFFISWLPHGEYILRYRLRPTKPGVYRIGAATLQSMYAPEMTAHSAGFVIKVIEK
jgi:uncharacterized protein YfaS (alpha-2-macroglobulin family)